MNFTKEFDSSSHKKTSMSDQIQLDVILYSGKQTINDRCVFFYDFASIFTLPSEILLCIGIFVHAKRIVRHVYV